MYTNIIVHYNIITSLAIGFGIGSANLIPNEPNECDNLTNKHFTARSTSIYVCTTLYLHRCYAHTSCETCMYVTHDLASYWLTLCWSRTSRKGHVIFRAKYADWLVGACALYEAPPTSLIFMSRGKIANGK